MRAAKVDVEKAKGVPLEGFEDAPVLRYADQATFHPLKYLKGLIAEIEAQGGRLFADSAGDGSARSGQTAFASSSKAA